MVLLDVEVRTIERGVHSGVCGGPVPDALIALILLAATFYEADGSNAVAGLNATGKSSVIFDEADLRRHAGVLAGVRLIGSGTVASRLWEAPAVSIAGIDVPGIAESSYA